MVFTFLFWTLLPAFYLRSVFGVHLLNYDLLRVTFVTSIQATSSDDDDEPIGGARRGGISQMGGLRAHSGNFTWLHGCAVWWKAVTRDILFR